LPFAASATLAEELLINFPPITLTTQPTLLNGVGILSTVIRIEVLA
jgi:hypothetical protein